MSKTPEEALRDAREDLDNAISWHVGREAESEIYARVTSVQEAVDKVSEEDKQRIKMWENGPCYLCADPAKNKHCSVYICDPCANRMKVTAERQNKALADIYRLCEDHSNVGVSSEAYSVIMSVRDIAFGE